jgi:UDP-glucose 4-epimerase
MTGHVLVTGSSGLVGRALRVALVSRGFEVSELDIRTSGPSHGDVRDPDRVRRAVNGCDGVVHLAAVSRVIWAEQDPQLCMSTNVPGLRNVLHCISENPRRPWLVFASSREVYGQPSRLPASEDCPLQPINVYGRSKVEGEKLVDAARRDGLRAAIVRLSNVFGCARDYPDRVVPAFARAVVEGSPLRVDGAGNTFDFTHIDDVTRGLVALVELLCAGEAAPPPIHFVTGSPTTLGELADLATSIAGHASAIHVAPPRSFDVGRFYGDPARASSLLGWTPQVALEQGLSQLIEDFRVELEGGGRAHES